MNNSQKSNHRSSARHNERCVRTESEVIISEYALFCQVWWPLQALKTPADTEASEATGQSSLTTKPPVLSLLSKAKGWNEL